MRSEHLGRQAHHGNKHIGLTTRPKSVSTPRHHLPQAYHRPICIKKKQGATTLHREVERRQGRGGGLPTPHGRGVEKRGKLVQPTLVPARRTSNTTKILGSDSDGHRPKVVPIPVISATSRDGIGDNRNATGQKSALSATERRTRGGRALRMERRGVQTATPSWRLLTNAQLRTEGHLQPRARAPTTFKTQARGRPRVRRYALTLPLATSPRTKTSNAALQSMPGTDD